MTFVKVLIQPLIMSWIWHFKSAFSAMVKSVNLLFFLLIPPPGVFISSTFWATCRYEPSDTEFSWKIFLKIGSNKSVRKRYSKPTQAELGWNIFVKIDNNPNQISIQNLCCSICHNTITWSLNWGESSKKQMMNRISSNRVLTFTLELLQDPWLALQHQLWPEEPSAGSTLRHNLDLGVSFQEVVTEI